MLCVDLYALMISILALPWWIVFVSWMIALTIAFDGSATVFFRLLLCNKGMIFYLMDYSPLGGHVSRCMDFIWFHGHTHIRKSKDYLHISKNYCTFATISEKKCILAVRFWRLNRITYRGTKPKAKHNPKQKAEKTTHDARAVHANIFAV